MQTILNSILLENAARMAEIKTNQDKQAAEIEKFNKMLEAFQLEAEVNQY